MLDWWQLARGALWIFGLALVVAAWSYVRWWAQQQHTPMRRAIRSPVFVLPFSAGLALFSLSLALAGRSWWEIAAWTVIGILAVIQALGCAYRLRRERRISMPQAGRGPE